MFTDSSWRGPAYESIKLASQFIPAYSFIYTHKGMSSFMSSFLPFLGENVDQQIIDRFLALNPTHGDDLIPIFNLLERDEDDQLMSDIMVKYWTNFAKYGTPSPAEEEGDNVLPEWRPFDVNQETMMLGLEPRMDKYPDYQRMMLWQRLLWNYREEQVVQLKHGSSRAVARTGNNNLEFCLLLALLVNCIVGSVPSL